MHFSNVLSFNFCNDKGDLDPINIVLFVFSNTLKSLFLVGISFGSFGPKKCPSKEVAPTTVPDNKTIINLKVSH